MIQGIGQTAGLRVEGWVEEIVPHPIYLISWDLHHEGVLNGAFFFHPQTLNLKPQIPNRSMELHRAAFFCRRVVLPGKPSSISILV